MAINAQKFLPLSKGGTLAKVSKSISKNSSGVLVSENSQKNIEVIRVKVIEIDKILKGTLASKKKELDDKKRETSQKRREDIETKLETKPNGEKGKIEMPKAPRMGFLDWVKNFIGNIILGYFAVRLVDHLPKIIPIVKFLGQATDFVLDVGGKLLDGLVTFIDWGYKAYDATRGFVKNLFGNDGVKQFDQLSSALNQFLNLAIIAGMVAAGSGGFGRGRGARPGSGGRPRPGSGGRPRVTTSGGGGAGGVDLRNPLRQRPAITSGSGGKQRLMLPGSGPKLTGSGAKGILSSVRPLLKRIPLPVVGALIDFGLSWALGENPGRAAFRAIGAGILGTIGGGLAGVLGLAGGPLAVATGALGAIAGGTLGDMAGGAIYDLFFGGKKPTGKTVKKAGGGITRGGKTQGGVRRRLSSTKMKKYKRTFAKKPDAIEIDNPGSDVGGEDKLFGLFPNPLKAAKRVIDIMNPFQVIKGGGENLGKTDYFGPILAITSKILLGQKPDKKDYDSVGLGINLLLSRGLQQGQIKGGLAAAFQTGGLVDPQTIFAATEGGDISDWVSRTFKDSIDSNAQKTLKMIEENLRLRKGSEEEEEKPTGTMDDGDGFEVGPAGSSGDKLTMARNLMRDLKLTAAQASGIVGNMAAESGVENARPQGSSPGTKAPLKVDGVTGYGLVQWTSMGRQQALADFAKSRGADLSKPLSMNIEYQFFLKEFQGAYGNVLKQIKQAQDVKVASTIFMQQYEIPAGYKTDSKIMERYNLSKPIFDKLAKGEGKATEGSGTYIGPIGSIGDGRVTGANPKAKQILEGAKKIIGMGAGVGDQCANTTRSALRAAGHPSANKITQRGDLDTPRGTAYNAPSFAASFGGSDIGQIIRNKSDIRAGDIILWRQTFSGGSYNKGAITHVGIAADDGLKNQYDHNRARGWHYRPHWDSASGTSWFAGVRLMDEGGMINGLTPAILGERGKPEGVIGSKITEYLEEMAPGTLPAIIGSKSKEQLANALRSFSNYGFGPPDEILVDPTSLLMQTGNESDSSSVGSSLIMATGDERDPFDSLYMGG